MATCKDCLHVDVCGWSYLPPTAEQCVDFKDKAKYVVREKGEWEVTVLENSPETFRTGLPHCGKCKKMAHHRTNFCPNCGSDMRRGENG